MRFLPSRSNVGRSDDDSAAEDVGPAAEHAAPMFGSRPADRDVGVSPSGAQGFLANVDVPTAPRLCCAPMRILPAAPGGAFTALAIAIVLCLAGGACLAGPDEKLLVEHGVLADMAPALSSNAEPASLLRRMHDRASSLTSAAMDLVGVRYRRGGTSADSGFDCSGFTRHVFEMSLGLVLPRRADEQATAPGLVAVRRDDLRPGDLVFFNTLRRTFSHVGIYIGGNRFVHSPRPGSSVRTEDMGLAYWAQRFTGARRAEADLGSGATAAALPAASAAAGS
jgi:cell wall-associated NlpC family hydrolase